MPAGRTAYDAVHCRGFFDLAILCHVLEHVEHERILLRELRRIARHVIVEVPIEHGVRIGRKIAGSARFGHINFYLPETVVNLLQTSGLRVVRSQICYSSLAYEQYCAGRARGLVMAALRRTALKASPRLAPWMLTYCLRRFACRTSRGRVPSAHRGGDYLRAR